MRLVIVGHGPAAHRLVQGLRRHGYAGELTVLGAERHPAYHRPLLGSVLAGGLPPEALTLPAVDADVRAGRAVTAVDRPRRLVHTDDGTAYPYDTLVLATGARPVRPAWSGPAADGTPAGVSTLRTLDDCRALLAALAPAPRAVPAPRRALAPAPRSVAVVGAGPLGVETAGLLREAGHHVTLVDPAPHPLASRVDATAGGILAERLERHGVRPLFGRTAIGHAPGALLLDDGERLSVDHVVLCAGVVPETDAARRAGLLVRTGIVVDERLRTSDPRIHAIGDCAEQEGVLPGTVSVAWEQADTLAGLLTGAHPEPPSRPARGVLRLRTRVAELAVFGPPEEPAASDRDRDQEAEDPGTGTVTFHDRSGGRYARLVLDGEGRVRSGVLLGLPRAAAALAQLYERDLRLPTDRLSFLLGDPPVTGDRTAVPDDAVVCDCNNVSRAALRTAWQEGARDLYAIVAATRATTGCGGCADAVRAWCAQAGAASPARPGQAGGPARPGQAALCAPVARNSTGGSK
ncbi:FAD-dependent oxidoreductase [Streptomyces sp. NPDC058486]|uniref:FAD-dependent oxidoreductase n=1 Tax=unclassified Streptomyces TaxID=2593676 RepID=UPI003661F759